MIASLSDDGMFSLGFLCDFVLTHVRAKDPHGGAVPVRGQLASRGVPLHPAARSKHGEHSTGNEGIQSFVCVPDQMRKPQFLLTVDVVD